MSDVIAIGLIVIPMALCWLYALAIERGMGDEPQVKP
jgi:hypothetical protein